MKLIDHTIANFEQNSRANRDLIQQIEDGLLAFNDAVHADPTQAPLTLAAQSDTGQVVAGLLGSSAYGWLRIDILWIHEQHRQAGIGLALMNKAEQIGIERQCHGIHLDTHSFQAPGFYKKLGYKSFGELAHYPNKEKRIYLFKSLLPSNER